MTEPVADLRHLSTRLPEDETGGDPQTGEGAQRLDDRAGDRIAGDPALNAEPDEPAAEPVGVPEPPAAPVAAPEPQPAEQPASEPLIPADNQPDVPAAPQE